MVPSKPTGEQRQEDSSSGATEEPFSLWLTLNRVHFLVSEVFPTKLERGQEDCQMASVHIRGGASPEYLKLLAKI